MSWKVSHRMPFELLCLSYCKNSAPNGRVDIELSCLDLAFRVSHPTPSSDTPCSAPPIYHPPLYLYSELQQTFDDLQFCK